MKDTFWQPMGNTRFRTNTRKHHNATCPYCEKKRKNIMLHYRRYHPEAIPEITGEIGEICGVGFIETTRY